MSGQAPLITILFLILTKPYVDAKNVVFLPLMATSHIRTHAFAAVELAKMNHTVWLALSSAMEKVRKAESYPGVNTFSYNNFWDLTEDMLIHRLEASIGQAIQSDTEPDLGWVWNFDDLISEVYFSALLEGKLAQYVKSLNPDLIVLDGFPNADERVAISYQLKVPFAVVTTLLSQVTSRIPYNSVAEVYNSPYFRNHASLYEQVIAVIHKMAPLFKHLYNDRGYMKQIFPTDPEVPKANELISQAEVYVVESDPIFDYPRPVLPNVKNIGGMSLSPAKELQEPFKSFVERSQKAGVGIAVLSFGSMFLNVPKKLEIRIATALKQLNLNTIWRVNLTSPDPDKILTSIWIPQNDLLGNKNVKIFLSHAGAHSLYEALYHGVSVVCLPVFYDQHFNAKRAEDKGYCRQLDYLKVTSEELVKVIDEVVSDEEMKSTIGTASEIYRQLYKNPRQEAAFWLDHVMKYGGSYMRYSGQKIPMYLFIMDYVIVFLAGVVFTLGLVTTVVAFTRALSYCCRRKRHLKKD